jgi:CRISPR-associated exonuclease Cas4
LNPILWETLLWVPVVAPILVTLAFGYRLHARRVARRRERRWRPALLQDATLEFVSKGPLLFGARVDRAYRIGDGLLLLAEFKSRCRARVYASDIIELSVQKLAIEGAGSNRVAQTGYVVIQNPRTRERTAMGVKLLSRDAVLRLARRRHALLSGTVVARRTPQIKICAACPYQTECWPASPSSTLPA